MQLSPKWIAFLILDLIVTIAVLACVYVFVLK